MHKSITYTLIALCALTTSDVVVAQSSESTVPRNADSSGAAATGTAALLLTKALSDAPGKEATMLTVSFPPGGASPAHRHNADVFVYVLEGAVVMQVVGGQEVTLSAGQTFYESPTDVHSVSRNASKLAPAKILVVAIKKQGAPLTMPAK